MDLDWEAPDYRPPDEKPARPLRLVVNREAAATP
jgi:hypothetical protein